MTQDEIEHMWKVASNDPNHDTNWHDPVVIAFAKLVAAKEREACAELCDYVYENIVTDEHIKDMAFKIRARGQA
jgi:hypothetical protein